MAPILDVKVIRKFVGLGQNGEDKMLKYVCVGGVKEDVREKGKKQASTGDSGTS